MLCTVKCNPRKADALLIQNFDPELYSKNYEFIWPLKKNIPVYHQRALTFFFFGLKKMYDAQNLEVDHCEKGNIYGKTISIIFDNIYLRLEILARTVYIILI